MKSNSNYSSQAKDISDSPKTKMPPGIPYIVGNELAETFSANGMRAILVVFMVNYLIDNSGSHLFTDAKAMVWYHNYNSLSDFLTIVAAIIADAFLGKYKTVITASIFYCFGHLILALFHTKFSLACALIMVAIGSGGVVTCAWSHLGDQFNKKHQHLLDTAYSWFYLAINLGAFTSILLTPYLLDHYGPNIAFAVPALLMLTATIIFYKGKKIYIAIPPIGWQRYCKEFKDKNNLKAIGNLFIVFSFTIVFYALYEQTGSAWVIQAEKMNLDINLGLIKFTAYPAQIQVINPILIIVLVPFFSYVVYPFVGKFTKITHLKKIATGFFMASASYAVITTAQIMIEHGKEVGIIWQICAFILLTVAEILVVIPSIEIAYIHSPRSIKSLALAFAFLFSSIGNELVANFNQNFQDSAGNLIIDQSTYFGIFAIAMAITAILFIAYIPYYRGKVYIQKMKTSLPARSIEHHAKIRKITEIILRVAKKKISFILFTGDIVRRGEQNDIVVRDISKDGDCYNFLIVTKLKKSARPEIAAELESKIRSEFASEDLQKLSVNIAIESFANFNLRVEGQRLLKEGILVYDASQIILSDPKQMTKERRLEFMKRSYQHWYNKGSTFLSMYELSKNRISDKGILAFLLHQATESFYACSLTVLTGNKPHTHDLKRLNYLLCIESNKFIDIFPSSNQDEIECFTLLQDSYADSRYYLGYWIDSSQLEYLVEKIEDLKDLTKEVCSTEIRALES